MRSLLIMMCSCAAVAACGDDGEKSGGATDAADAATETATAPDTATPETMPEEIAAPTCEEHEVPCSDQQVSTLQLKDDPSGGKIIEVSATAGVFVHEVDATAGGFNGTKGYTYARFTEAGLEAVDISDEDALESTAWDLAFRRFVIRLNSGVSGPACVTAATLPRGTEFDAIKDVADGLDFEDETYFDADANCKYRDDGSGIGSPDTIMSSFWNYTSCVQMTGRIFILALGDGRSVKVQILSYYEPDIQAQCDEDGSAPTPNGSGTVRIQWAFLP